MEQCGGGPIQQSGVAPATSIPLLIGLYALLALTVALLAARLSPRVEALPVQHEVDVPSRWRRLIPRLDRSRRIVLRLAGLFSVDALAGGLVVQSLMSLFFHLRFGVALGPLAVLFFAANTLSALSFLAAAPLAQRIGLLNTMVFTHLPSNVFLALVPLMPTFPLAALVASCGRSVAVPCGVCAARVS